MVHPRRLFLRANAFLIAGVMICAVAIWLRMEAYDFSVQSVHVANTPGTKPNAEFLDREKFDTLELGS